MIWTSFWTCPIASSSCIADRSRLRSRAAASRSGNSVSRWQGKVAMRIEPRARVPIALVLLAPIGAILASLVLCSGLIALAGAPVLGAFALTIEGAVGSTFAIAATLTKATPLIFTGLSVAVAFRSNLWNIGAEGQLYLGAIAAVLLGGGILDLPPLLMIPLLFAGGFVAGAMLLLMPATLKIRFGVDEVVTTLLLNFIVLLFVSLLLD